MSVNDEKLSRFVESMQESAEAIEESLRVLCETVKRQDDQIKELWQRIHSLNEMIEDRGQH